MVPEGLSGAKRSGLAFCVLTADPEHRQGKGDPRCCGASAGVMAGGREGGGSAGGTREAEAGGQGVAAHGDRAACAVASRGCGLG